MSQAAILSVCPITRGDVECYTASWYLIGDQVRYWALFQVPILVFSVIYEWLELSNNPRLERLRTFFDAPVIQVANCVLQVITCIYVCVAWIVRGGALAVSFSSWSIESFLLILTAIGYGVRWIAAKHKVSFTIKFHSLLDLLSLISHFTISFQAYAVDGRDRRSWLDFGFLRVYILYIVIDHLFTRYQHKTFAAQALLVVFKAWCLVFFAACVLFSLERLGDLPYTNSFLLHVYKCTSTSDSSQYILVNNLIADGVATEFSDCSETWSFFSSIYFMFVTVSTVGYGDFSPKTVLGQLTVCMIIVIGIYTFANESAALLRIYGDQKGGIVQYNGSRNTAHVVVTGNPSAAQMKDFIREFFHSDHDAMFENATGSGYGSTDAGDDDDDGDGRRSRGYTEPTQTLEEGRAKKKAAATKGVGMGTPEGSRVTGTGGNDTTGGLAAKWMQRNGGNRVRETHIVVLMRFDDESTAAQDGAGGSANGGDTSGANTSFQEEVTQFVDANPRYHKRVFLIYGSPLKAKNLAHAKVDQAMAVFFLPNKFSNDGSREDAATVLRVLSVSQHVRHEQTQLYAMLVNSENRTLLEATGLSSENLVCADELRLGLMGLSCRCPGLSTLVSNLITSRSADLPVDPQLTGLVKPWIREYVAGASNEIYSCVLADFLVGMTFTQCTQRIHKQSDGQVLLIAVEYEKQTHFNPGHWFRIPPKCRAFLIAESMTALASFKSTNGDASTSANQQQSKPTARPSMTMAPTMERPRDSGSKVSPAIERKLISRARHAQHTIERRLPKHVRDYVTRCGNNSIDPLFQSAPTHPPMNLLAMGGHIVVCSNVGNEGSRSISRLVSFLRPLRAPHIETLAPVVIVDSEKFDAVSWLQLREFGHVYHVHGSPQKHHVLVNAGVYTASAIVVLAQGTDAGYDDSKAIFNAILINAAMQQSHIFTIIELRDVHNNKFLDPVPSFSSTSSGGGGGPSGGRFSSPDESYFDGGDQVSGSPFGSAPSPHHAFQSRRVSSFSHQSRVSTGTRTGVAGYGARTSSASKKLTWWGLQKNKWATRVFYIREFFSGSFYNAASRMLTHGATGSEDPSTALERLLTSDDSDTFFQERFMRGALFPSSVADDLLIQSFFNPSLNEFVRKILDGTSCFMLYNLPVDWRQGTQTYGELFEHMTSGIASALPIGLLRARGGEGDGDSGGGAPHPYVYTSPASSTVLYPDDKVFVLIDVTSIHRVANKLQRRFRSSRRGKSERQLS